MSRQSLLPEAHKWFLSSHRQIWHFGIGHWGTFMFGSTMAYFIASLIFAFSDSVLLACQNPPGHNKMFAHTTVYANQQTQ